MTTWQPRPGELLLARCLVTFATGVAPKVSGMRWFRDTDRNDIQGELPGWPEGPVFTPRSEGGGRARSAGRSGLTGLFAVVVGGLESLAGSGSVIKGPSAPVKTPPEDPENEVEDFPVMWAAPGTIARTLPWQLDRGRRPAPYQTKAFVTDQRLIVIGYPEGRNGETEVLWECRRSDLEAVERKTYSREKADTVIRFADGSWCRLHIHSGEWFRYLAIPNELIPPNALTPGQLRTVDALVAESGFDTPPVISRRPSGNFLVEQLGPEDPSVGSRIAVEQLMDLNGEEVPRQPGDYGF
ncbi:hypothetical protein [Streptomyces gilvus]|uniref:hypothetical protein n=1 Tax=Streptomyces gilvus TaxID=2920937 RepID=UPI001F114822|nr:hypothetical protein [Streptomyces sp. CME 23]MCH5676802.1 hypothetical protein [Streptomyces sp. CME 23]